MSGEGSNHTFEELLVYLKTYRGFDFTGYKRNSLKRRTRRRMQVVGVETFDEYRDYLEVHPDEFVFLFNTILINVTSFFRDEAAWEHLAAEILPRIVESRAPDEPIRAWSAGCASGEEAYSAAILLWETFDALGIEDEAQRRIKIYATDVDEEALAEARCASYTLEQLQDVPQPLRHKYFEPLNGRYIVRPDLRRAVIFGRHDLAQDAPISNLDLLICRNTLIYFNAETQRQILARFHFALKDEGVLFLGQAEMLLSHAHLFSAAHVKHRLFARRPQPDLERRIGILAEATDQGAGGAPDRQAWLRQAALDAAPVAHLVVDQAGRVVGINGQARASLDLDRRDVGRPFQDLEISYRPVELRSLIDQAEATGLEVVVSGAARTLPDNKVRYMDLRVIPLQAGSRPLGTIIVFEDVTPRHDLEQQVTQSRQELETTYEELQSTNEELETTNEELQSAIEELQTTNEELQSTNEEMETINEELHSSNDELREMNVELRRRTVEAQRAKVFLESILSSLDVGVVVLDRDLEVVLWNHRAQDLWGLRAEEVQGRSLLELDIGLPVKDLREPLHAFLSHELGEDEITVDARNRRGQTIKCHLQASSRLDPGGEPAGIVLLMEEERV